MAEPAVTVAPAVLNNPDNPTLSATPKDRRLYTCLCGFMHIRTGALVIGAIQTLALSIALITVIVRYAQGGNTVGALIGVIISVAIYTVGLICLFLAIRQQRPRLLLPYFAVQALAIGALVIYAIVLAVNTISVALNKNSNDDLTAPIVILVVVLLATAVNTWFTIVVAKYHHFLRGQV